MINNTNYLTLSSLTAMVRELESISMFVPDNIVTLYIILCIVVGVPSNLLAARRLWRGAATRDFFFLLLTLAVLCLNYLLLQLPLVLRLTGCNVWEGACRVVESALEFQYRNILLVGLLCAVSVLLARRGSVTRVTGKDTVVAILLNTCRMVVVDMLGKEDTHVLQLSGGCGAPYIYSLGVDALFLKPRSVSDVLDGVVVPAVILLLVLALLLPNKASYTELARFTLPISLTLLLVCNLPLTIFCTHTSGFRNTPLFNYQLGARFGGMAAAVGLPLAVTGILWCSEKGPILVK